MWITNAAVPLGVPSIERDGHPFFGFWKNRTPTPNSTLIYRFCFAAFEEFFKRHFTSNLRFTDSELVLIDHRNRTCYLWFSEKPAFGCYDTSWVSDSLGSTKMRMCSKLYARIMNYTVLPRWGPNDLQFSLFDRMRFGCDFLYTGYSVSEMATFKFCAKELLISMEMKFIFYSRSLEQRLTC